MDFRLISLILLLHISGGLSLDLLSVTCEDEDVCALRENTVQLRCSYSEINIKTVFWFSWKQSSNWRKKDEPEDLTLDWDYSGRVKQEATNDHSTLTISDLRERDSGEYQLMFMKDGVKRLGSVAVNLTVTDLQVRMNPATTNPRDQRVILTCGSSCDLPSRPQNYYWKNNGHYIYSGDNIFRGTSFQTNGADGSYSCSLTSDHKISSSPVYTMVKSSPDIISEGQEMILSCSTKCTLNDKHTYIWYKNGQQVMDGFTKDNKLYLDSVSDEELQEYSCAVGEIQISPSPTAFSHYTVILLVFLPQFLIIAALWMWFFIRMHLLSKPN